MNNLHKQQWIFVLGPITIAISAAIFAWWMSLPPDPVPATAPADLFSAERAHQHIARVCTAPQPAGSVRNDEACNYIEGELKRLGLETEVLLVYDKTNPRQVSRRRAVLGRIRGTNPTKAFAMDAHFDSVPWGPGASDDWAGIAAMLETARALKSSPPLRNDIIFVFADQEEFNMGGAKAFCNHPWFKEVGVMLGLETRGTSGPSLMFETSPNNGFVLRELARSGVGPRANSIMYDIYKRMPFNSDFEHYKNHVAGMNLAFINGFDHYHTVLDNPENVSLASLQHHGNYTLGLARHFGAMDLTDCYATDAGFFNTLGGHLVVYPLSWGLALTAIALLFFVGVLVGGLLSGRISLSGTCVGVILVPLAGLFAALPIALASYFFFTRFREMTLYQNNTLSLGMVAVGLGLLVAVLSLCRRWCSFREVLAGGLVWWSLGLVLFQWGMPGGANLALIPLFFGTVYLLVLLNIPTDSSATPRALAWSVFLALPVIMFLTPPLSMAFYAVTVMLSIVLVPLVFLVALFVAPQLYAWPRVGLRLLYGGLWVIGVGLTFIGYLGCLPSPQRPLLNCLAYGVDFDSGEAWWLSSSQKVDEWLRLYLPADTQREQPGSFLPYDKNLYLKARAPMTPDGPPKMELLSDTIEGGKRRVSFHISSPRHPQRLWLRMVSDAPVHAARVLGYDLEPAEREWEITLEIMPLEGTMVEVETDSEKPLRFSIREMTYGLPPFNDFVPRPPYMAPEPNRTLIRRPLFSDITYSIAFFEFPPSE